MTKVLCYLYLGDNGSILTPVKLDGIYSVKKYRLIADDNHKITKDGVNLYSTVTIPEAEVSEWYEIAEGQV